MSKTTVAQASGSNARGALILEDAKRDLYAAQCDEKLYGDLYRKAQEKVARLAPYVAELEWSAERARDSGNDRQAERYMRRASRLWARVKGGVR